MLAVQTILQILSSTFSPLLSATAENRRLFDLLNSSRTSTWLVNFSILASPGSTLVMIGPILVSIEDSLLSKTCKSSLGTATGAMRLSSSSGH